MNCQKMFHFVHTWQRLQAVAEPTAAFLARLEIWTTNQPLQSHSHIDTGLQEQIPLFILRKVLISCIS